VSIAQAIYLQSPPWAQNVLLSAYGWRIKQHRYSSPYRAAVRSLLEQERWTAERIRAYQDARVRTIVDVAYRETTYYRRLLDERGMSPADIQGIADLPKLPLLTRDIIRARGHELMTRPRPGRGWLHGHTSGTTGSPLSLWYDRATCVVNNAVDRRQKAWGGMPEDAWIGLLLGRVIVPPMQRHPPFWRTNWMLRQAWFSSFHMSDETLGAYVTEMRKRGLQFLEGYPSTLYILASYLRRRGTTLPMRAVFSSSETLLPLQRSMIEEAFGCPLFDFYGLAERVIFAGECERHVGKHISEEFGYVEVVDEEGLPVPPGQPGYLVGTSLHNTAMPMIRYRTTDYSAIWTQTCVCGRTSPRLRDVTTKAEDIVVTPDGRMISPSVLTHPFKPLDQIVKSQLVQEQPDHLLVKIVASDEFRPEHERQLVAALQERLGSEVTIEVRVVNDIPCEASGKYRWVISRVKHDCHLPWAPEPA
jgi:phenylacetate-CoA ligase